MGLVETRNSLLRGQVGSEGYWQQISNYGPDYSGDFYREKFILEARQALLYGKIPAIVDSFLLEILEGKAF